MWHYSCDQFHSADLSVVFILRLMYIRDYIVINVLTVLAQLFGQLIIDLEVVLVPMSPFLIVHTDP